MSAIATLVRDFASAIGEAPVVSRYIDDAYPDTPHFGAPARDKAVISMWDRRIEQEGFASVREAIRNKVPGLKDRAIAGLHDYAQIPALIEQSFQRAKNLFADMEARLTGSVADIALLVTVDFAAKAIDLPLPHEHVALRRWHASVSGRPSASD